MWYSSPELVMLKNTGNTYPRDGNSLEVLAAPSGFPWMPEDVDPHIHPGCKHMGQKGKIPKPSSTLHLMTWHMEFGKYREPSNPTIDEICRQCLVGPAEPCLARRGVAGSRILCMYMCFTSFHFKTNNSTNNNNNHISSYLGPRTPYRYHTGAALVLQ